jgi:hypothetical protein
MAYARKTVDYRKIYKDHNGDIPVDLNGRTYEIHHIDGDHSNNHPSNLKAITIKEHYDIHYSQEDYGACWFILLRMGVDPGELSQFSREVANKKVAAGTHHFLGGAIQKELVKNGKHIFQDSEFQRRNANKRVKDGTHPFLNKEAASALAKKRLEDGTHNFIGLNEKRIKDGTHNFIGEKNPSYDPTIYTFQNRITNEQVAMTGRDFTKKYQMNKSNVRRMINGFLKSVKNWVIVR